MPSDSINRPDERRREEARKARANQARPLAEPESSQGDSPFSRVPVLQQDELSKRVMDVLGPYRNVLGGPSTNGPRIPRTSDLLTTQSAVPLGEESGGGGNLSTSTCSVEDSKHLPNSVSTVPSLKSPSVANVKRPSTLPVSQPQSAASTTPAVVTPSKQRPSSLTPVECNSLHPVVPFSSPVMSTQSPVKGLLSKDNQPVTKESETITQDTRHASRAITPPVRDKLSMSSKSQAKDAHHEDFRGRAHSWSKERTLLGAPPSSSGATRVKPYHTSPNQMSAPLSLTYSASKDHTSIATETSTPPALPFSTVPATSTVSPSSNFSPTSQKKVNSISPIRPRSSFSSRTHAATSPRPHSTTPTKVKHPHLPNGLTSQHPKLTSAHSRLASLAESSSLSSFSNPVASSNPAQSPSRPGSALKVERAGQLKLLIPNQINQKKSAESDLNHIFKEMTELQPLVTAIETPQKMSVDFPFYAGRSPNKHASLEAAQNKMGDVSRKELRRETDEKTVHPKAVLEPEDPQPSHQSPAIPSQQAPDVLQPETSTPEAVVSAKDGATVSRSSSRASHNSAYRSQGKVMPDDSATWVRDLDLSEDSDSEASIEDEGVGSHSKQGKVMARVTDTPDNNCVSPMSSSSSASSDSEAEEENANLASLVADRRRTSERRSSTSSSSTSSSSLVDPSSELDSSDPEDAAQPEMSQDQTVRGSVLDQLDKTPSPGAARPVNATPLSQGTPSRPVQENTETGFTWSLIHFMQPKKNSSSPANVSPLKSVSPPTSHSAPASVQRKEPAESVHQTDQVRPRALREMEKCNTMSFERQTSQSGSLADQDDDSIGLIPFYEGSKVGPVSTTKPKVTRWPNAEKQAAHNEGRKLNSREITPPDVSSTQEPVLRSTPDLNQTLNQLNSATRLLATATPAQRNPLRARVGSHSSSNDEIDVESLTPEEKSHSGLPTQVHQRYRSRPAVPHTNLNGVLRDSSEEDSEGPAKRVGNKLLKDPIKHHKRKEKLAEEPVLSASAVPVKLANGAVVDPVTPSRSTKHQKKDGTWTIDQLEVLSRPPNLLSPIHSTYSSPPTGTNKPLPSFGTSFSPLNSSTPVVPPPPHVTLTRSEDGLSRPRIMVHINKHFVSSTILNYIKEKRERRKRSLKGEMKTEPVKLDKPADMTPLSSAELLVSLSDSDRDGCSRVPRHGEPVLTSPSAVHSIPALTHKSSRRLVHEGCPAESLDASSASSLFQISNRSKSSNKEKNSSNSPTAPSLLEVTPNVLPLKASPTGDTGTGSLTPMSSSKVSKSSSQSQGSTTVKISGASSAVKNLDFAGNNVTMNEVRLEKNKMTKRKMDVTDETLTKKSKSSDNVSSQKTAPLTSATVGSRRDSSNSTSSPGSHQSSTSKKARHTSLHNKTDVLSHSNTSDKVHVHKRPDSATLPFDHYVNGNNLADNGSVCGPSASSLLPPNLPPPSPIETQLLTTKDYIARAREHKHIADDLKDKPKKYEPYLRSGLNFFLAGYTLEQSPKEQNTSYTMYNDTYNLLQYVVRMISNSSTNPDSTEKEKKITVLVIRLQAYLNHKMYRLRRAEVSKLKKVIESEQPKYSSTPIVNASSSTSSSSTAASSRPHAPSPHQANWSKNSTGTPSPMSPTPSPAGSVSSQGSCELVNAKLPNGTASSTSSTPLTSPSPGMVNIPPRLHAVTQKYFLLTSHMVKALELWDQADSESRCFEDFFNHVDAACGALTFHSDPPFIVRYMKHALRLLDLHLPSKS